VTTEKDLARLQDDDATAELVAHAHALPVTLVLEDAAAFKTLLLARIARSDGRGQMTDDG